MDDILKAVGPSASLIFAAWIFLSFLQQRDVAAFETCRALVGAYRQGDAGQVRLDALASQVRSDRRRCDLMRWATNVGTVSAICFLTALLAGMADVLLPGHDGITWVGGTATAVGLALVIVAACLTLVENTLSAESLDDEARDIRALHRR